MSVLKTITEWNKFDPRKYGRKHTPDLNMLSRYKRHLVFVPCNMQENQPYHKLLNGSEDYGWGYTRRKFIMYRKELGRESFPVVLPGYEDQEYYNMRLSPQFTPESAVVKGELWWVDTETLSEKLDNYKLNGVEFIREQVEVRFTYNEPYRSTDRDTGQVYIALTEERVSPLVAWMYVGVPDYWINQLDAGFLFQPSKPQKCRKKWLSAYHEFSV